MPRPMVLVLVDLFGKNPFLILISCLLSLRAKDSKTLPVCIELFSKVRDPHDLLAISIPELARRIYSLGLHRKKALVLHRVCRELVDRFDGKVPSSMNDLLGLPGVGRKTANLILAEAFDIPALCVDTHVHRLANLFEMVCTKTPEQTEYKLRAIIPQRYWTPLSRSLVAWGQNINRMRGARCGYHELVHDLCMRNNIEISLGKKVKEVLSS